MNNIHLQGTSDCLFIFSPDSESHGKCFNYHLGSAYIISYLKSMGFHALQFIHEHPLTLKSCVNEILDCHPRIIGFSVYDANFNISLLIAEQIRKISPATIIVFGGPCPSIHSGYILKSYSFVDICFLNESEESFLQLISLLTYSDYNINKIDLTPINGIAYRSENNVYTNHQSHILFENHPSSNYLDRYPSPYLNGVIPGTDGYITGILTARGCNQNCTYCNCSVLSGKRFSTHSVERVIGELDFISRHMQGNQALTFQDDAFTLIPHRACEICSGIINNKIKVRLACVTRCDRVDETLLDQMKEAGFVSIAFSLESAIPETLRRIGKVNVAEDIPSHSLQKESEFIERFHSMTAYAKKIGIEKITASIMVGLLGETIGEARKTVEAVARNKNIDQYAHNFLKIFKGTPLAANFSKYGYQIEYINNNPAFTRTIYVDDFVKKVDISAKSNYHLEKKINDKNALRILSLSSEKNKTENGFRDVILQSDVVDGRFIHWLTDVLAINGTIIQLYSDKAAMVRLEDINRELYIKYSSPSLKILNYCFSKTNERISLISSLSLLIKSGNNENIKIFDFEHTESNLNNPDINFINTLCREAGYSDSVSAYSYLYKTSRKRHPFSYLINIRTLPYFANLCKWTREQANCLSRSTLIINAESEIRFCWYGSKTGTVGDSYEKIINCFESEKSGIMLRRKCSICKAYNYCIKCPFPFPLTENKYCTKQRSADVTQVAELITGLDQIKQLI